MPESIQRKVKKSSLPELLAEEVLIATVGRRLSLRPDFLKLNTDSLLPATSSPNIASSPHISGSKIEMKNIDVKSPTST